MKKILFIIDNWFEGLGGRKKITLSLVNDLDDFEIGLLTLDTKVSEDEIKNFSKDLRKGVKIRPYFMRHNLFLLPRVFFKFGLFLKKTKPNLVVSVGGGTHSNAFFVLIAKIFLSRRPLAIISHGNPEQFLKKQNFILRYLTKLVYQKTDKVISVSKEVMENTKKNFNLRDNQCAFIYNGFELEDILKKSQEKVKHPWFEEDIPIILSAARLDAFSKDFPVLLKAFSEAQKSLKARLVILGDGLQKEELKKLAKDLNIEKNVWFAGFQRNPYKFMSKSRAFVLSSKFEAFPLVLVEAMICDVPVISSDCDFGPREILENGKYGILVPVGDAKKMAEAIIRVLTDGKFSQELIEKGNERIQNFTIEKTLPAYTRLFNEII